MKNHKSSDIVVFLCFFWAVIGCRSPLPEAINNSHIYSTWEGMEFDKAASIWLIKRFIDKDAEFKFFPSGSIIKEGTAFDTPDAIWNRTHNASTYETLLREMKLASDPALAQIGVIVNDLEINNWAEKKFPRSLEMNLRLQKMLEETENEDAAIHAILTFFDNLYEELKP